MSIVKCFGKYFQLKGRRLVKEITDKKKIEKLNAEAKAFLGENKIRKPSANTRAKHVAELSKHGSHTIKHISMLKKLRKKYGYRYALKVYQDAGYKRYGIK